MRVIRALGIARSKCICCSHASEVRDGSKEHNLKRVEFAIKLRERDEVEVLLPADAKVPLDDSERLLETSQARDAEMVTAAASGLETRVCGSV